jgi:hypothetical protein
LITKEQHQFAVDKEEKAIEERRKKERKEELLKIEQIEKETLKNLKAKYENNSN